MEGMTEEQKELEAMKLVRMFDRLSRSVKAAHAHAHTHYRPFISMCTSSVFQLYFLPACTLRYIIFLHSSNFIQPMKLDVDGNMTAITHEDLRNCAPDPVIPADEPANAGSDEEPL